MDKVEVQVKQVISEQFGIATNKIANSHNFADDLGADSLDKVSLLVALEDSLNVEITDEQALKILTVQDAIDFSKLILKSRDEPTGL